MSEAHLINAINMMKRSAHDKHMRAIDDAYACGEPKGDIASYYNDQAIDILSNMTNQEFIEEDKNYQMLIKEAERRNLHIG